ncbi:hypothetical protein niasHT_022925 [Heterodera trifolii]|uniref:Uncharacterized protein n=1 Tax=Heterodera trifolii TaxID=157864 RepID=A0ABD2JYI4_9BILA
MTVKTKRYLLITVNNENNNDRDDDFEEHAIVNFELGETKRGGVGIWFNGFRFTHKLWLWIRQCAQLHDATAEEKNFGQRRLCSPIGIHNSGQIADQKWRGQCSTTVARSELEKRTLCLFLGANGATWHLDGTFKAAPNMWEQCFLVGASVNHRMCIGLWGLLPGKHRRYYEEVLNFLRTNNSKCNTTQDETTQDETTRDETTQDETTQDETTRDETTQDETTRDETTQDETTRDEITGSGILLHAYFFYNAKYPIMMEWELLQFYLIKMGKNGLWENIDQLQFKWMKLYDEQFKRRVEGKEKEKYNAQIKETVEKLVKILGDILQMVEQTNE